MPNIVIMQMLLIHTIFLKPRFIYILSNPNFILHAQKIGQKILFPLFNYI